MLVTYQNRNAQGQTFTKEETLFQPDVNLMHKDKDRLYSLVMLDPDAGAPYFLHWMIININLGTSMGQEIVPYYPPTPPTGTHRYIFYLLQQPGSITMPITKRNRFSLQSWIHTYGLRAVDDTHMRVRA